MTKYLIKLWIGLVFVSELIFFLGFKLTNGYVLPPIKNEMDETYSDIFMAMQMVSIFVFCICSLPMFLNLIYIIRKTPLYRFFSFFLLPLILGAIALIPSRNYHEFIVLIPFITIFFVCLTLSFFLFSGFLQKNKEKYL